MPALGNLKKLKIDMENKKWLISSFMFHYKTVEYIVLVKLYMDNEKKPKYALLELEFVKINNIEENLIVTANVNKLLIDARTLRTYFGIDYSNNLREILIGFYQCLGRNIPIKVQENIDDMQKTLMDRALSKGALEDLNRKYCYAVKRNKRSDGTTGMRSDYNDNITRIRRPILYEKLGKDRSLSFCYSFDEKMEKGDAEIIENWTKRNCII